MSFNENSNGIGEEEYKRRATIQPFPPSIKKKLPFPIPSKNPTMLFEEVVGEEGKGGGCKKDWRRTEGRRKKRQIFKFQHSAVHFVMSPLHFFYDARVHTHHMPLL